MDSFGTRGTLTVGDKPYEIYRLHEFASACADISHLPYSLRILLENLLRTEDGTAVTKEDIESLANWNPKAVPSREIAFTPARVLLQDFTGVPARRRPRRHARRDGATRRRPEEDQPACSPSNW